MVFWIGAADASLLLLLLLLLMLPMLMPRLLLLLLMLTMLLPRLLLLLLLLLLTMQLAPPRFGESHLNCPQDINDDLVTARFGDGMSLKGSLECTPLLVLLFDDAVRKSALGRGRIFFCFLDSEEV